jgi:uncharacterized protein YecE (DUF72 family)
MGKPRIHIGSSGWTYDDWSGSFYPQEVKGVQRLSYYAERFDAVEINVTFYRSLTQPMIDAWNRRLPETYHLAVKGPRTVTHRKKLRDCREPLAAFVQRVLQLRALRVILWQLPPSLKADVERLDGFLAQLPGAVRHAVEFRDESWWTDKDTAAVLSRHRAAFVAVSHPTLPNVLQPTTDFLYVRFHGVGQELYRHDYSRRELASWASRLRPHLAGRTLFAFFNNTYNACAPRNASVLRDLLSRTKQSPKGR